MTPATEDLWFLPLGGTGEIGMNLNLYGHDGAWLMVDCGVTFKRTGEPGPQVQMPDPGFIVERRRQLQAIVVTHAHEDHVGAVAHLWPKLRCPVYTTPFTAEILKRKLAEAELLGIVPLRIVAPRSRLTVGPFDLEWVNLTHSTPESQALVIRTGAGTVFHTGDWKLDPDPVVGPVFDRQRFEALGDEDVLAMVCDSTNATVPGRSPSEAALYRGLKAQVAGAPGRVVIACFGSNVARLHTLAKLALHTGRHAGLLGRSLRTYHRAAVAARVWDDRFRFIDSRDLGYLPRHEVLAIATGSQGESRAALDRLASGTSRDFDLEPGDRVLFSSRVIPGNEPAVAALVDRLGERGVDVVQDEDCAEPIHASGHPAREELADMYRWVRPRTAIPVHGEDRHMAAHAALARELGVDRQLVGRNGDLFMLAPARGLRRGAAATGRLGLERDGLRPIAPRPETLTTG
ncbi:MAG: ribonuclease J [Pseudomonadota bacterium]